MWRLLRAETEYNRTSILISLCFGFALFTIIWIWGKPEFVFRDFGIALWAASFSVVTFKEKRRAKEKRERYHSLLPVEKIVVGLSHIFYPCLLWILIFIMFIGAHCIITSFSSGIRILRIVFPLNGILLISISLFMIHRDLRNGFKGKSEKLVINIIWFVVVLTGYFLLFVYIDFLGLFSHFGILFREQIGKFFSSLTAIFLFTITGLGLCFISVFLFVRRNFYME